MGDRDAFGRKKDEDPLAAFGWDAEPASSVPEAEPETPPSAPEERSTWAPPSADAEPQSAWSAPSPDTRRPPASRTARQRPPQQAGRRPGRSQSESGRGAMRRAPVAIGLLVAVVIVLGALARSGADQVDRFVRSFTTPVAPTIPAVPTVPAVPLPAGAGRESGTDRGSGAGGSPAPPPPRGLGRASLLRPYAFGRAITRLRSGGHGRLVNLRVAPERINATLLKDGDLRFVQITPGGDARVLATSGGSRAFPTMALNEISAGAPSRLTRAAAARLEQPPSRVSYLVYSRILDTARWSVHFTGGEIFMGDARGRITRRIS
ncbi:MAG: hypothetical protein Q8O56_13165 [Solirubrobacteraceae bacterium]|nr:hypothetical protein [Solirubrobacteraceae bacterium]